MPLQEIEIIEPVEAIAFLLTVVDQETIALTVLHPQTEVKVPIEAAEVAPTKEMETSTEVLRPGPGIILLEEAPEVTNPRGPQHLVGEIIAGRPEVQGVLETIEAVQGAQEVVDIAVPVAPEATEVQVVHEVLEVQVVPDHQVCDLPEEVEEAEEVADVNPKT